jgi:phosphoribosylglycinamide formyltransferase-1
MTVPAGTNPLALGVLISGRGSNLAAILDACASGGLDAAVRLVVSNRPDAPGLGHARAAGVPARVLDPKLHGSRAAYDAALADALSEAGVAWVVLAGFMRILTRAFLDRFEGRIVNIHPSLLPAFPGLEAQRQALAHGVCVTGCTVHLVDEGVDSGPILAQAVVPVRQDDTTESLSERVLVREHELLVRTLRWIAEGRLHIERPEGGRARARWRDVEPGVEALWRGEA